MNTLSTFPFCAYFTTTREKSTTKGLTSVGDDCWIGLNAIILSGARLEKGCVVGAGSVVRGHFEPYSVIMGNPAVCVKKRLPANLIPLIKNIPLQNLTKEKINALIEALYTPLDADLAAFLAREIGGESNEDSHPAKDTTALATHHLAAAQTSPEIHRDNPIKNGEGLE